MLGEATLRLLSRREYDDLVESGYFGDARVELLRGEVVSMSPQGPRHAGILRRLTKQLVYAIGERAQVQIQSPIAVSSDSEPEPDAAVIPPVPDSEHPATAYLVVELADSSLPSDRGIKRELYATACVPEYWIINVRAEVIEVHTEPRDSNYAAVTAKRRGDTISLCAFPDIAIAVSAILS